LALKKDAEDEAATAPVHDGGGLVLRNPLLQPDDAVLRIEERNAEHLGFQRAQMHARGRTTATRDQRR
jgi:hypothetical protein